MMIISAIYRDEYGEEYFEIFIAIASYDFEGDTLDLEIFDQLFSTEIFNITIFIYNKVEFEIESTTIFRI